MANFPIQELQPLSEAEMENCHYGGLVIIEALTKEKLTTIKLNKKSAYKLQKMCNRDTLI